MGRVLASSGPDKTIRLWDVTDPRKGRPLVVLQGPDCTTWSLSFSPDGRLLATAGSDKFIRIWDVSRWTRPDEWNLGRPVRALAWMEEQKRLVALTSVGAGWLLVPSHEPVEILDAWKTHVPPSLAAKAKNGRQAIAEGSDIALTDREGKNACRLPRGHDKNVSDLLWGPLGLGVLLSGGEDGRLIGWDPDARRIRWEKDLVSPIRALAASPNNESYAVAAGTSVHLMGYKGATFKTHIGKSAVRLAFSPDKQLLAVGHDDGSLSLYGEGGHKPLPVVPAVHKGAVRSLTFMKDDRGEGWLLVSGGEDGIVRL